MAETQSAKPESVFAPILAKTGQPPKIQDMLRTELDALYELVTTHNSRVLRVQASKAADPNNAELLDSIRRSEPQLAEENAKFEAIAEEYEKALKALREKAKAFVQAPLSPEELAAERKTANEEVTLINEAKARAESKAEMVDAFLEMLEAPVEGGVMSLIPPVESLRNARGKKSGGTSGAGAYRTRFDSVSVDGSKVSREVKKRGEMTEESNLILAAELLNKKWGAEQLPQNGVTDEELERAMYASQNVEFRAATELPESFSFEFKKDIAVQQPNDNSVKNEPQIVKFDIVRNTRKSADNAESDTDKSADENAKTNEAPEPESAKGNAESGADNSASAPKSEVKMGPATAALKAKQEAAEKAAAAKQAAK